MALHFIASINTHIYGVRYDQGEEVDITDWSRKQILQFLGMGLISPSQTTTEDVAGAPQVIDWLDDVDTSTTAPLAGQALIFSSGQWRPGDTIHVLDVLDDVDTTTVAPTDAQVLTYQSSSGKWKPATPSGGGGGGAVLGPPDAPPTVPSAYDDEFTSFAGWTALGALDSLNVTDVPGLLHMKIAASGAWTVFGVYKACPSFPFTVTCKVSDALWQQNYQSAQIMLTEAAPGKIMLFGNVQASGSNNSGVGVWNSRTSRASYVDTTFPGNELVRYLRLKVNSSTSVDMYYSTYGLVWQPIRTAYNPGFTVGAMGLAVSGQDGNVPLDAFFEWFRVT